VIAVPLSRMGGSRFKATIGIESSRRLRAWDIE